jgi:hypothetical protein
MKLGPCLSLHTSIHSNWIKDFDVRAETLRLVQERTGNNREPIGTANELLSRNQLAQQLRECINKWDYMTL